MSVSVKVQSVAMEALRGGHVTEWEARRIVDTAKAAAPSEVEQQRVKAQLSGLLLTHGSSFEPAAKSVLSQYAERGGFDTYFQRPDGHYAAADIYATYASATADGQIDPKEAARLVSQWQLISKSGPTGPGAQVAKTLLHALVQANPQVFSDDALALVERALTPIQRAPIQVMLKAVEDNRVTKAEANQLVKDVESFARLVPRTDVDRTLLAFRVDAQDLLTPAARRELDARLGVVPDRITYQPEDKTLAAVLPRLAADNHIGLPEARELIAMSWFREGTTYPASWDLDALLALYGDRMDPQARKELEQFVASADPIATDPMYWGDAKLNSVGTTSGGRPSAQVTLPSNELPMRQLLERLETTGGTHEVLSHYPQIVDERLIATRTLHIYGPIKVEDGTARYALQLVVTPATDSQGSKQTFTSTRHLTAAELLAGGAVELTVR